MRQIFPGFSVMRMLNLMLPLQRAIDEVNERERRAILDAMEHALGRPVSERALKRLRVELRGEYLRTRRLDSSHTRIKSFFRCTEEAATRILVALHRQEPRTEGVEPGFVAILAVCIVEALLVDTLRRVALDATTADLAGAATGFRERHDLFERCAGVGYREATAEVDPNWWPKWSRTVGRRNQFVHGNPGAVTAETSSIACSMAVQAVGLHAVLNNRFVCSLPETTKSDALAT